jgi:hypothetical protein
VTAKPDDIARFTNDGVVLTVESQDIHVSHPDADSVEYESMFDSREHGLIMLQERFAVRSMVGRVHESVELADRLGLGTDVPIAPTVPAFTVVDDSRGITARTVVRAYSFLFEMNKYAVELVGMPPLPPPATRATADSTIIHVDNTSHTSDET